MCMYCVGFCMQLKALCTSPIIGLWSSSNNYTCTRSVCGPLARIVDPKGGPEAGVSLWDGPGVSWVLGGVEKFCVSKLRCEKIGETIRFDMRGGKYKGVL